MFKKIGVTLLGFAFVFTPYSTVNAESSYTYTIQVEQPTLDVSMTSQHPNNTLNMKAERNASGYFDTSVIDTYTFTNGGESNAHIWAQGTTTRIDGGTDQITWSYGGTNNNGLYVYFFNAGTTTATNYLSGPTSKNIFDLNAGTSKMIDLKLRMNKNFDAEFTLKLDFSWTAI
ncbi:hypothetical protein AAGG74_15980 [Bacillus mexicanus]|uniref:hypothetical protein n=1 Tax=Bacillus mexicanus TaxID=2834415 RepID=UPI003D1C7374